MVPAAAVKAAVVAPEETVIEAGTVRSPLLLLRLTSAPPAGAAWDRVTVQVEEPPLLTVEGAQEMVLRTAGAFSVTLAVFEPP